MNVLKSKWGTIIAIVLVVWIGFGVLHIQESRIGLGENIEELNDRLSQVEEENAQLEKDLNNLDNPEYIKTQAKIKLNYKMAEEELVYIYRDKKASGDQESLEYYEGDVPRYKKWWHWLLQVE